MSKLMYKKWADNRNEILPVGNGRIGAMIYGNPLCDVLSLNEETLWSGGPEPEIEPYDMEVITASQKLLAEKKYEEAEKLLDEKIMRGVRSQTYMPLGKLSFELCHNRIVGVGDYKRELDLKNGVYSAQAGIVIRSALNINEETVTNKTECFVSLTDDVLVYHCYSENPVSATISLDLKLCSEISYGNKEIFAVGRCPTAFDEYNKENILPTEEGKASVPFALKAGFNTDGNLRTEGKGIAVYNAKEITIIISVATGFNGYNKNPLTEGKDCIIECNEKLHNAMQLSYDELKSRHISKFSEQFSRSEIKIDGEDKSDIPTDERIRRFKNGEEDLTLINLLFDYGKYLMISSSQPGGQPSNLQGIWNEDILAPWNSNYTLNINTQMNYWATEAMNLPECHLPALTMVKELAERGNNYGLKGWCTPHNTDLWRFNRMATRYSKYGLWDMGGAWMARHIYDHFSYTQDFDFLKEYINVLRGIYDFLNDRLIENENGKLILSPTTSPETSYIYDGKKGAVSHTAAMDIEIIEDYLIYMAELEKILGNSTEKYDIMREKLCPLKISKDGRLLEYVDELEPTPDTHQHISHLYAIYPGTTIKEGTPLFEAARKELDDRTSKGGAHNGWANIWTGLCYARFKDGKKAYERLLFMLNYTIYPNMFNICPPFQIDGNFGICALICEMLLQGDSENYTLLPAIPENWKSGKVRGLKLRGGKSVSFSWKDGKVYDLVIR